MTEEREKELVAVYTSMVLACTRTFAYPSARIESSLRKLIRTVAAEAREEGLEEGYRAGFADAEAEPDRHLENSLYEWLKDQP